MNLAKLQLDNNNDESPGQDIHSEVPSPFLVLVILLGIYLNNVLTVHTVSEKMIPDQSG